MRVIGGKLKGLRLNPPSNLPARPTTDQAKEGLFNILINRIDLDDIRVLDLFSGTGNISIEFASRGVPEIISVDREYGCVNYLRKFAEASGLQMIKTVKNDVFKYLDFETEPFDLIFADPPYDLPQMNLIAGRVFERNLLNPGGLLIIEHPSMKKLNNDPRFIEQRQYGSSSFSFFGLHQA